MRLPWRPVLVPGHPEGPPILTSLTERESRILAELAFEGHVLEVGAAYGYSTIVMARMARRVTSVDPHIALDSRRPWDENTRRYGVEDKVDCLQGYSGDWLPSMHNHSFDLVFIDGDHSEEAVSYDIREAVRLVRARGFIAVHDYGEDTCPGVRWPCDLLLPWGTLTDTLWVARC